jgi:hypothetical protein
MFERVGSIRTQHGYDLAIDNVRKEKAGGVKTSDGIMITVVDPASGDHMSMHRLGHAQAYALASLLQLAT